MGELLGHCVSASGVGERVFASAWEGCEYLLRVALRDLQFRGFREGRCHTFSLRQDANFLLYKRVLSVADALEYEMLRQAWDRVNRPKYESKHGHAE